MNFRTAALFLTLSACGSSAPSGPGPLPPSPPPPPGTVRILMLGNSLTQTNDLPGIIERLAVSGGEPRPLIESVTPPDFSLEDHWNSSASLRALDQTDNDVVILQQGPSSLPDGGAHLADYSARISGRASPTGARVGLFMVWTAANGNLDGAIANYTAAADASGLALYPVGRAFMTVIRNHPEIRLHAGDMFHPSHAGSWLAGMVIAATIFEQDPMDYPNLFDTVIPAEWETPLRQAARDAVTNHGRR